MNFGEHLFGGSRFIFWALTPFLLGFAILPLWMVDTWTPRLTVFIVAMEIPVLCLVLGLYDPIRFRWALRVTTGMVFALYLGYLVDMWVFSDKEFSLMGSKGEASSINALLGFIIIGIPSLIFTIKGRFTLKRIDRDSDQS